MAVTEKPKTENPLDLLAAQILRLDKHVSALEEICREMAMTHERYEREIDRVYHELGVRRAARRN